MYFTLQYIRLRAYLKNHSRNLHILLCENFKCFSISEIHLNHEI